MSLLETITSKAKDLDAEVWREQDSSCLLCNAPISLDFGADWPDDSRLLLCWGCMSQLCAELITELDALKGKA